MMGSKALFSDTLFKLFYKVRTLRLLVGFLPLPSPGSPRLSCPPVGNSLVSALSLSGMASSLGASCFCFPRSDLLGSLSRKTALAGPELQPHGNHQSSSCLAAKKRGKKANRIVSQRLKAWDTSPDSGTILIRHAKKKSKKSWGARLGEGHLPADVSLL